MKTLALFSLIMVAPIALLKAQETSRVNSQWYVPDFITVQYAGSIGFISAGAGYEIFKKKSKIDFLFGYVPAFTGSEDLRTITFKFTATPLKFSAGSKVTIYPLTTGVYFCYTPGREFSSDLPSWYPNGYYWWSEAVRVNIFIGGSAKIETGKLKVGSHLAPYYEIGTNEIKLVSYVQNRNALSLPKILHAGVGVRYHF